MITRSQKRVTPAQSEPAVGEDGQWMQTEREDMAWFAFIYERYFQSIYRYCLRRVGIPQEAEDLTSHIFVQALTHLHDYRGGMVAAWLFQIARHTIATYFRQHRSDRHLEISTLELPTDAPDLLNNVIQDETEDILRTLVAALSDADQELLALKIAGQLTSREIAEIYGKNQNTVRVMLHRVIAHLRQQYQRIVEDKVK